MAQLSDTQRIILSAAAQRDDRHALPLPPSLRGGTATKVVNTMISKGLLKEVEANLQQGEPLWRETGEGHGVTLVVTDAGLAAIGIEPEDATEPDASQPATGADMGARVDGADNDASATENAPAAPTGAKARTPRESTKQAKLITMLRSPDGATIAEIVAATGWQSHTVRGAMAGALKKKLGLVVTSDKIEGRGRVYRLPAA